MSTTLSTFRPATTSPLVICDQLISLAQQADRAGMKDTARDLMGLMDRLFDAPAARTRRSPRARQQRLAA